MSYGVLASKTVSVMVETTAGYDGSPSDDVLDRFLGIWGPAWVTGRLTLTRLHVNVIPHRAGRGMAMMDLDLRDVEQVERDGARHSRVLALRTATHLVHVRCRGSAGLAEQVAELAAAAKRLPPRMSIPRP